MDPIAMQNQIRQNASEMYDYLEQIQSWQKNMKQKEASIGKNKDTRSLKSDNNASIRNQLITEVTHSEMKEECSKENRKNSKNKNGAMITPATISATMSDETNKKDGKTKGKGKGKAAAHTYENYKKWDNLDIDAELDKLDKDDSKTNGNSSWHNNTVINPSEKKNPLITEISSHSPNKSKSKSKESKKKTPEKSAINKQKASSTSGTGANQSGKKDEKLSGYDESVERMKALEKQLGIQAPARNKGNTLDEDAQLLKSEGNNHFSKGRYTLAIESYTKAIKLTPNDAKLFANRALVRLKCNDYELAERDCSECIRLDNKFVKALYRRGIARSNLEKYSDAIDDFNRIIEIEPNNNLAKKEIETIKLKLEKIEMKKEKEKQENEKLQTKLKQDSTKSDSNTKTRQANTTNTTNRTNTMRRITIEEGSDSDSSDDDDDDNDKTNKTQTTQVTNTTTTTTTTAATATSTKAIPIPIATSNVKNDDSMRKDGGLCKDRSMTKTNEEKKDGGNEMKSKNEQEMLLNYLKSIESINNFIEFEKLWIRCHSVTDNNKNENNIVLEFQTQILWKIRNKNWKTLFENMVGDTLFNQIITTIHYIMFKKNKVKAAWKMLEKLAAIDRFEMLVMFMEDDDTKHVKEMKQACSQNGISVAIFNMYLE